MIIKSKIKGQSEWLFIEDVAEMYLPHTGVTEKKTTIKHASVTMNSTQLTTAGIFLLHADIHCQLPVSMYTEVEGETITSQFIFYKMASFKKLNIPGRSRHNIRYIPSAVQEHEMKSGVDYSYFLMVLSKEYYFHLINRHSSLHEDFVTEIEKGQQVSFTNKEPLVTPEMMRIIQELKEGHKTGEVRRLHTEAKVMELLIYQLEQLNDKEDVPGGKTFRQDDIEKLEAAREILENNFVSPPSQKELAQAVAINESKLRRGFKEYYATTIYDYIIRLRMEYARKLLLEKRMSIMETAILTGYNHQNNFSSAFKKYFGISPSDIRYM